MTAYERVGEFGTLKALGKRDRDISRLIILENSMLGFIGASLGVLLGDGARKNLSGELLSVDGEHVTIRDRKAGPMTFAFADLADAKLILTDALIAATRPLDSSGADEIQESEAED